LKNIITSYISSEIGFPGDINEYVSLSENGVLFLKREYWSDREQIKVNKNEMPNKHIKGVYINSDLHPEVKGDISKITPKMLPNESRGYLENISNFGSKLYYKNFEGEDLDFSTERLIDDLKEAD